MNSRVVFRSLVWMFIGILLLSGGAAAQTAKTAAPGEWEKIVDTAKKQGRVVVSIPTSAELRRELDAGFKKAYPGIEIELNAARGAGNIYKIIEEHNAGLRTIDLHVGGTTSIITGLLARELLEPVLPEVQDAENWWGGHIWADNAKRFIYSFTKETLTPDRFHELENVSESVVEKYRRTAMQLAEKQFR
jgi:iron(III) transport system substrate-binding protein